MSDIIKEFNMIDLLGMLLPGALVTALLGTEFGLWLWMETTMGIQVTAGIVSVILIIVGFTVGTLLHELGDVLEDLLWSANLLNPKVYAAVVTGYADYYRQKNEAYLLALAADWKGNRLGTTIRGVLMVMLALCCAVVALGGGWTLGLLQGLLAGLLLMLVGERCFANLVCTRMKGNRRRLNAVCLHHLARCNRFLSFDAAAQGAEGKEHLATVMRKRDLFEGFKAMSRNLLLALVGLAMYGDQTEGLIHALRRAALDGPVRLGLCVLCLGLLLMRYYHYSYLKFKYSYEDQLQNERKTPAEPAPHLAHLTVRYE